MEAQALQVAAALGTGGATVEEQALAAFHFVRSMRGTLDQQANTAAQAALNGGGTIEENLPSSKSGRCAYHLLCPRGF